MAVHPLEAGCTLVKNPRHLTDTFSSHTEYYNFANIGDEPAQNFYEYGLQNSRGFRALKVWMSLLQADRKGYEQMISEDIALARYLNELAAKHPELEAMTSNLSINYLPLCAARCTARQCLPEQTERRAVEQAAGRGRSVPFQCGGKRNVLPQGLCG